MSNFISLHNHGEMSILDGVGRINEFIDRAKELGQDSFAFTEHGNMCSFLKAYIYAKTKGIKIIPGFEAYLVDDMKAKSTLESDRVEGGIKKKELAQKRKKRNHIVLLAKNEEGYKNLLKISSLGFLEGFYYKPRIDLDLIEKNKNGLIAMTSCVFGEIPEKILLGNKQDVIDAVIRYKAIFGDDLYFEIQPHNFKEQIIVDKELIELSRKYNIKLVATNDVHYVNEDDYEAHHAITMLNMRTTVSKLSKERLEQKGFHLKDRDEIYNDFISLLGSEYSKDINMALDNTVKIADQVNVEVDLKKYRLPTFKDIDVEKIIKEEVNKKWKHIVVKLNKETIKVYKDRMKEEYEVIKEKNLLDFIYVIYDLVKWCQKNEITVGVGRGSVGGSLLCYLLDITKVDPIKYDLLFSRFLNKNRIELADIDIDFDSRYRDRVKKYLTDKYGKDKVASIGAFGTFKSRGLLRDLGRVFEIPLEEIDMIAKCIPMESSIKESKSIYQVRNFMTKYPKIFKIAEKLEGQVRHFSTHAAGILISNDLIYNDMPLCVYKNEIVTGWDEGGGDIRCISAMNMMKLDCLGLSTLSVIKETIDLIKQRYGKDLYKQLFYELDTSDRAVLNLAYNADTIGVFQFEGRGIREFLRKMKVTEFEHLIAANALYRPSTMVSGLHDEYALRKNKIKPIKYAHPLLENSLKRSYGLLIYQEDSMRVAKDIANYTYDEADDLRKITSKGGKLVEAGKGYLFDEARERFVKKCIENKIDEKTAREIFKFIEAFVGYGFNRCLTGDSILIREYGGKRKRNKISIDDLLKRTMVKDEFIEYKCKPFNKNKRKIKILSYDEINNKQIFNYLKNIHYQGKKQVYEIELENGYKVKATSNHRFLTSNGWKKVCELNNNDNIYSNIMTSWNDGETKLTHPALKRLSDKRMGNDHFTRKFGGKPHNYGKTKENYEPLKKMSDKLTGRKVTDEKILKNLSISHMGLPGPMKGRKHTRKARNKIKMAVLKQIEEGRMPKAYTSIARKVVQAMKYNNLWSKDWFEEKRVGWYCIDIVNPKLKIAILPDGDYWHTHPKLYPNGPVTKAQKRNAQYDKSRNTYLIRRGWNVIHLWESDINNKINKCIKIIKGEIFKCRI